MLVYCSLTVQHSYAQIEPAVFHYEKNIEFLILRAEAGRTHYVSFLSSLPDRARPKSRLNPKMKIQSFFTYKSFYISNPQKQL